MMKRLVAYLCFLLALSTGFARADEFQYHPPGALLDDTGDGRLGDRTVYFEHMAFPLAVGPGADDANAYIGSQIYNVRGGSANAIDNYVYPWRDNFCEKRPWDMPMCPGSAKGHQGVDIRPSTPVNVTWNAIAMADGVVTQVTNNTTVTVRSDNGYYCRYLHLGKASIADAGIAVNVRVRKGVTVMGKVSNIMGGIPNTSIHLHFDCYKRVNNQIVRMPVYTSLIAAYRVAFGMESLVTGGQLGVDAAREMGGEGPVPPVSEACPPLGASIGTETRYSFSSLWIHNCSLVGLVAEGTGRKFVYVRPTTQLRALAAADPVLFEGVYEEMPPHLRRQRQKAGV